MSSFFVFILITALLFVALYCHRARVWYPKAEIKQEIFHKHLDDNTLLVNVAIVIKNIGNVAIKDLSGYIYLQLILPLNEQISGIVEEFKECDENDCDREILFPRLALRRLQANDVLIEPLEVEKIHCDFIFNIEDYDIKLIKVYSFIENKTAPLGNSVCTGWNKTSFYEFN